MVDNDLMVRRFTPAAQKFFSLIPTDLGRQLFVDDFLIAQTTLTRTYHTATLLPNDKVLVTSGLTGVASVNNASPVSTAELYNPATDTWTSAGNLATARAAHGAALLANGKVLVVGGHKDRVALASAEVYDPNSRSEAQASTQDAAEYLAKKGVVNIGTDCVALDNSLDTQFSTHMLCKKYGTVNTESLANLGRLINRRFMYFGLPLNLPGGTGSPIRAFAYLPAD